MGKFSLHPVDKVERFLLILIVGLLALVLVVSAAAQNVVEESRENGSYTVVENAAMERFEDESAPTGVVIEYRFTLEKINHADTLAFYINHHNIEIYLADELLYSVFEDGGRFRTTGGIWAIVPIYKTDMGKEVRVVLYPLYRTYQDEIPTFLIGSELEIYELAFLEALPELILSLCVILAGLVLIAVAVYHTINGRTLPRVYAIGSLSLSAGIWRFTYGKFAYLLFAGSSVLVYTLSIISLMVIALSMLCCVEPTGKGKLSPMALRVGCMGYCLIYIVQLGLQFFGIADLRQMLQVTHITLVISALVLFGSGLAAWLEKKPGTGKFFRQNYSWLLGVAVLLDLLLYYFAESSAGMLCTLSAILWASLMEGIRVLVSFMEQKNALEEMKTRLTLSRTTTMMSQIRSHFVFNILNAISGMCKYDPEMADDTIVRFARYLRSNIDIMEKDENIPFSTDLRQLEDYVALEQVRFGDKIEFYADVETDQFMIPPLILQPVVENAIKHGVSKKLTNGTIILRTRDRGDHIAITVEDDGVGFDMAQLEKEKSVGIRNIRFRLEHLVGGSMEIQSKIGVGTTVTITIPKKGGTP